MKYVDTSAVLRLLFGEPGPTVTLAVGQHAVSSELLEVEAARAIDRLRLLGEISDEEAAVKRKGLADLLTMLDRVAIHRAVIDRAQAPFGINVRALDAIHVATAEILATETGEAVEFWTHDDRQRLAALSRGMSVYGA